MSSFKLSRRGFWMAGAAAFALPSITACASVTGPRRFPANGATDVNPDTQFKLTFDTAPEIGNAGFIRIFDAGTGEMVDEIDMSIPAGPDWHRRMPEDDTVYQSYAIGGYEDFHAYPVIVRENTATLYPHQQRLEYGKTYYVTVDPDVLSSGDPETPFEGFTTETAWTFTTKAEAPAAGAGEYTIAADGSGDFTTVQGAVDFMPEDPAEWTTLNIKDGYYEEIVYARGKKKLIFRGESRDGVQVGYGNNSAFNVNRPRYAFSLSGCEDIQLSNFTISNLIWGQAEALMARGERIVIERMNLFGSGDAIQLHGSMYFEDMKMTGDGDSILTTAAAFFKNCELHSIGPIVWPRTSEDTHGSVFVGCLFVKIDEPLPWTVTDENPEGQKPDSVLARLPDNGGYNWPFGEMVLINCRIDGVIPRGWTVQDEGPTFSWDNLRLMEFNSMGPDGEPLDMSERHGAVRILDAEEDAELIANYSDPEWVLGWEPVIR